MFQTLLRSPESNLGPVFHCTSRLLSSSSGEVWDSLFESCFPVHCGSNFVLSGDHCVPAPDALNATDTLLTACAKIHLQSAQFERRPNGSVHVFVYDRDLEPGQFEEHEGGLLVCAADPSGDISFKYNSVQEHISFVCFTLSVVCLAAHILVHTCFSKLRNLPAKNLLSLSCALLMAQLLYLTGKKLYPERRGIVHFRHHDCWHQIRFL